MSFWAGLAGSEVGHLQLSFRDKTEAHDELDGAKSEWSRWFQSRSDLHSPDP